MFMLNTEAVKHVCQTLSHGLNTAYGGNKFNYESLAPTVIKHT